MLEIGILGAIALVLTCSLAGGLATTWRLHRRTLKLEHAVDTLEEIITSKRNRESANKRWSKEERLEAELEAFRVGHSRPAPRERFANEPLNMDEMHGLSR